MDISKQQAYERHLRKLAEHDLLTGLYNRRAFEVQVRRHLAGTARHGPRGAVILIDLDNFKPVNDTFGHGTGDAVLCAAADALAHRTRASDLLARLDGDEFGVLLSHADVDDAAAASESLLEAIRELVFEEDSKRFRISGSAGYAVVDESAAGDDATEILRRAGVAMYEAKHGRDRSLPFDPESPRQQHSQARIHWLERIRAALEQDDFTLYWQPILDIATGEISQHEALLRMRDGRRLIPPGDFLPTAERYGLIRAIDRWVLETAMRAIGERGMVDGSRRVEINLSAASLADPALPALIAEAMDAHEVEPSSIVFEVTETAAMANVTEAREFLTEMVALGCRVALDDFGSGFGSFYYFKHLPFDHLKIDGEFIRALPRSRTDQLIVQSLVDIAHGTGRQVVAECVTDSQTLELLRDYGVDFAQGYYIGEPAPQPTMEASYSA
jgi:diguanylate cyclase (GGDEF)-like protein